MKVIFRESAYADLVRGLPYIVVYRIDEARDELTVVAIFHGARDR